MIKRTFGWVQNPSNIRTLKAIVGSLITGSNYNSELIDKLHLIYNYGKISLSDRDNFIFLLSSSTTDYPYTSLKGSGSSSGVRADALCTGIVQAAITGQQFVSLTDRNGNTDKIRKPYTDNWTAEGYIRWAISTGLIEYNRQNDSCSVSDIGIRLADSDDNSPEEHEILSNALLAYPPVYRVLKLLSDGSILTKFEIGSQLGFKGEMGFTSIPQCNYIYDLETALGNDKSKVRQNLEGDADKYARGIASWCCQMKWLKRTVKTVSDDTYGKTLQTDITAWQITREGQKAITKSNGNSSNPKIPKIVTFEMLATKGIGADYLRKRRACLINLLKTPKNLSQIEKSMADLGFDDGRTIFADDIKNFGNIGLRVIEHNDTFRMADNIIGLTIPKQKIEKENVIKLKNSVAEQLCALDHSYLELIDLAYSDSSAKTTKNADAREFEIKTAQLFIKELGFGGLHLGGSNKPDIIIYEDKNGIIVDNKSYKDGFSISASSRDEMMRYIEQNQQRRKGVPSNEWWNNFPKSVNLFEFLFITSYLTGNFAEQLKYINTMRNINGAAIGIKNLLLISDKIKIGEFSRKDFFSAINNEEIVI